MNQFSERLKNARKLLGLTQEQLAEQADISRVMVTRYESGQVIPTVEVLVRIADALHISIDYLLGREASFLYPGGRAQEDAAAARTPDARSGEEAAAQEEFPRNAAELRALIVRVFRELSGE